ncbi:hypothetical protein GBAR_LOCUS30680 [Geodia barretti]|uniref:Uncharacterized protein n=1 Tax=Geodia barretti TaxID=519541 RepID=A0AA35XL79_GEOBA|nr:hypothetical protein GBAR_LOCUS30680 [Geodia barretti]
MPPSQCHEFTIPIPKSSAPFHSSITSPTLNSTMHPPQEGSSAVETGTRRSVCRSQESREDHRLHKQHSSPSHRMPLPSPPS